MIQSLMQGGRKSAKGHPLGFEDTMTEQTNVLPAKALPKALYNIPFEDLLKENIDLASEVARLKKDREMLQSYIFEIEGKCCSDEKS